MRVRGLLFAVVVAGLVLFAACGDAEQVDTPVPTVPAACRGGAPRGDSSTATPTTSAEDRVELTRDQIILCALQWLEMAPENQPDPSTVTARRMSERQALETAQLEGAPVGCAPDPPSERPVWLVEVSGEFGGFIGFRLTPTRPPFEGRRYLILDLYGLVGSGGGIRDSRQEGGTASPSATPCQYPELSQEQIVQHALELLARFLNNRPDPSTAAATRMTYGEALETVLREGAPPNGASGLAADLPVWLVEVRGVNVKVGAPGTYVFILNLHGGSEYDEQILDATATP